MWQSLQHHRRQCHANVDIDHKVESIWCGLYLKPKGLQALFGQACAAHCASACACWTVLLLWSCNCRHASLPQCLTKSVCQPPITNSSTSCNAAILHNCVSQESFSNTKSALKAHCFIPAKSRLGHSVALSTPTVTS